MIGETLGKCRIESLIGAGGMGMVYRATHLSLGVPVAVKVIRPELTSSREATERLLREAQLVARLRHPNVVRVYDVGEEGPHRYIVMELLEGSTLDRFLDDNAPIDLPDFFRIFIPLAEGLGEAHKAGIVHRDVKPANVIVGEGQKPVLTDFGIAAAWSGDARLTKDGNVLGTPAYMSPEQARGARELDGRSDVFSLGMMMFEALTGRLPQMGRNFMELIQRRVHEDVPPISTVAPTLPGELIEVVSAALARTTERRIASGAELTAALRRVSGLLLSTPPELASHTSGRFTPSSLRVLEIPGEESEPIVEGADIRYTALLPLISAAEKSKTGYGLLLIHYRDAPCQLLLFAGGAMQGAYRWRSSSGRADPVSLETVTSEYQQAAEGVIDVLALSGSYYRALELILSTAPAMSGLRAAFVDFLALLEYLGELAVTGVVTLEHQNRLGFVLIEHGEVAKLLCDPWFEAEETRRGIVGLSEALGKARDAHLMVHREVEGGAALAQTVADLPLDEESVDVLLAFVVDILRATGAALEREFGLGTRAILAKHLHQATMASPVIFDGLELDKTLGLDALTLRARIESLPRTGRRTLVLRAFETLVAGRARALTESLRSRRKQRRAAKEILVVWRRHQEALSELDESQSFERIFRTLEQL